MAEATKSLQRIHALHDECLIVGNLLTTASTPAAPLHEACGVALSLVGTEHSTVAAVHIGEASGAFTGERFVRYDVHGPALEMCDRVMQLCGPNEALITEDVLHILRDVLTVSESSSTTAMGDAPVATFRLETLVEISDTTGLTSGMVSGAQSQHLIASQNNSSSGHSSVEASKTDFNIAGAARAAEIGARLAAPDADPDARLQTESTWCFFLRFKDDAIEVEYLQERTVRLLQRASTLWMAYAAFLLLILVLLLADFFETRLARASVILLCACILAAVGVSVVGAKLRDNLARKGHLLWSSCAVLVPLGVVISVAMARPSIVGNDLRSFVMIGALMRSPLIVEVKHQLVMIPVFLALSQLHLMFPGALLRFAELWAWAFVLLTITSDARQDRVERQHFVNKQRIVEALQLLGEERKLREGLVRSQLPGPLWEAISTGKIGAGVVQCRRIPDTIAVVVTLGDAATSRSQAARLLSIVEDLERRAPQLHVAKIVGSVAIMTNVIMDGGELDGDNMEASTLSVLLQLTEEEAKCAVLVDIDSVIQRVSTAGLPSFEMLGPAIGRLLSLRATGSFASGTYVTDRVLANVRRTDMKEVEETLMPPVRIRGVGMVRMTKVMNPGV